MPTRILTIALGAALLPAGALAHLTGEAAHDSGHGLEGAALLALAGLAVLAVAGAWRLARRRNGGNGDDT
jgi:hypothetical protein